MRAVAVRLMTVLTVVLLIAAAIPPAPAAGAHGVDLVNVEPTGWAATVNTNACPENAACDASDASGTRVDDHCGSQNVATGRGTHNYCSASVAWTRTSGVTTFNVSSFRALFKMCQTGAGSTCGGDTLNMIALVVTRWGTGGGGICDTSAEVYYEEYTASPTLETDEVEFTGTLPIAVGSNTGFCFHAQVSAMNTTQWFTASSIEVYAEGVSLSRPFTDYVYDLRLDHPPFERVLTWAWKRTWAGAWHVTDSDDTVLGGTFFASVVAHERVTVRIQCAPICGADTYTITITEDGGYDPATYDIASTVNGQVLDDAGHAFISYIDGCYNATANGCVDATLDGAADALVVRFTLVPEGGAEDPARDYTGTVTIGRWDRASGFDCAFVGSTVTTVPLALGAHAPQTVTAWDQTGGYFNSAGAQYVLLMWTSTIDGTSSCATVEIPISGGASGVVNPPVPGDGTVSAGCVDVASCIGVELRNALSGLFGVAEDVWSETIDVAHDAMLEKVPFAYIVIALDGIDAQLERASLEVESSDDCAGITLPVPLYYGTSPSTPTPTTLPITVLNCASLEPVMGQTWYQAVRSAMDPALWLLFAWAQLKALQPKTSLNG